MNAVFSYLTRANIATILILFLVVAGLFAVATGTLSLDELVQLLDKPVAALVIAGGLATIRFAKALPGEPVLGIAALLIVVYAIVGLIQVLTSDLTFEAYLKLVDDPAAGLAIGKGLFANNS